MLGPRLRNRSFLQGKRQSCRKSGETERRKYPVIYLFNQNFLLFLSSGFAHRFESHDYNERFFAGRREFVLTVIIQLFNFVINLLPWTTLVTLRLERHSILQ